MDNTRIRVTVEITTFRGYHSDPYDLECDARAWLDSAFVDRDAWCKVVNVEPMEPETGSDDE